MNINSSNYDDGHLVSSLAETHQSKSIVGGANTEVALRKITLIELQDIAIRQSKGFLEEDRGIDSVSVSRFKIFDINLRLSLMKDVIEQVDPKLRKESVEYLDMASRVNKPEVAYTFRYDSKTGQIGSFEKPNTLMRLTNKEEFDKKLWLSAHSERVELTFDHSGGISSVVFVQNEKNESPDSLTKEQILVMTNIAIHNRNKNAIARPTVGLKSDYGVPVQINTQTFWKNISVVN